MMAASAGEADVEGENMMDTPAGAAAANSGGLPSRDGGEGIEMESINLHASDALESVPSASGEATQLVPDGSMLSTGKNKSLAISAGDALEEDLMLQPPTSLKNLIISSVFGNMLEWYDFGVFASFSTEISKAFFTGGRLEELLEVYGVFAVAFFARPVGGFLLGLIGDRYARTLSLQISVVAMGISALIISILPTNSVGSYAIGPTATVLIVIVRVVQGLSVGGEMVGSMLYMVENVPPKWKLTVSCVPMASAIAGTGTGYLVSAIITWALSEEQRLLWGWRLAFALGVPAGAVGFMFRTCLSESHSFSSAIKKFRHRHQNQHPFFYALKMEPLALVVLSLLSMVVCGYYAATIWYNQAWLEEFYTELIGPTLGLTELQGRILNTFLIYFGLAGGSMVTAVIIDTRGSKVPLFYYIAVSGSFLVILTPVFLWLMSFGNRCYACVIGGQLGGMLFFLPTIAPLALFLVSQFPVQLQYTSIALSYNVGQACFGGTMPYVATSMTFSDKLPLIAPSYYVSFLAMLGVASVLLGRLQRVRKLVEDLGFTMNS